MTPRDWHSLKNWRAFLFLAIAVVSSGCVIRSHWVAKGAGGMVCDADSGVPLADVMIYREIDGKLSPVAQTDSRGEFHVAAKRSRYVEVFPFGDPTHLSRLVFRKKGFLEAVVSVATITGDVYQSPPPVKPDVKVQMQQAPNPPAAPLERRGAP